MRFSIQEIQNHLPKQPVDPGKPIQVAVSTSHHRAVILFRYIGKSKRAYNPNKASAGRAGKGKSKENTPRSRPFRVVPCIYRLMNQSQLARRPHELPDSMHNFSIIIRGHDLDNHAHGPGHAGAEVRPTGGVEDGAGAVIGV